MGDLNFESVWILSAMAVMVLSGVGIYMGSQSRSHVIVTKRVKFWLRLTGTLILTYFIVGFYVFYTIG